MSSYSNNIGFLRLVFASLVIVGHAPEMTDGNRFREPLAFVFHTVSLGELAVDAFFLLSGYLVAQSLVRAPSVWRYLQRRVLRIYPAFVVSYLLCVFVLGPIVGAQPTLYLPQTIVRLILLQPPCIYPGQLAGIPIPHLNGAMWTIYYEFQCYLLVAVLGTTGILARKPVMLFITVVALTTSVAFSFHHGHHGRHLASISPGAAAHIQYKMRYFMLDVRENVRMTAVFLVGVCFYIFKGTVLPRLRAPLAMISVILAAALMYDDPHFAEPALIIFGGTGLFWLALNARLGWFQNINNKWDVSYGVYLYGWPIATFILWKNPNMSPWLLASLTLPLALAFGAVSWWGLERWAKDWGRSRSSPADSRKLLPKAPLTSN